MKVNGVDAKKYNAKQLTVEIQPPKIDINYDWVARALQPNEFHTDIAMGSLKLCMYFRGKDRNGIMRSMSEFMANFTESCDLTLDGYKGKYRGFLRSDDYEKTLVRDRHKLNLELDGYFYDDEVAVTFDGVTGGYFLTAGSRKAPCIIEIYAKNELSDYVIKGLGDDDITIQNLASGETIIINGIRGTVTASGKNAFDKVSLWEFPSVKGKVSLLFSNNQAKVTIRYHPMWI